MKVQTVLAVVAILGVSFYTGQKSFNSTVEYTHSDVVDAIKSCVARGKSNSFIGGCKACKDCNNYAGAKGWGYNYAAGGCSYFKDTFCTKCTPIKHCKQTNTICNTKDNSRCIQCEPGFTGPRCAPCTQCNDVQYVKQACTTKTDTVCAACRVCTNSEYLVKACRVRGNGWNKVPVQFRRMRRAGGKMVPTAMPNNSVCKSCTVCKTGKQWTRTKCETPKVLGQTKNAVKVQFAVRKGAARRPSADTVCSNCHSCMDNGHETKSAVKKNRFATAVCNNKHRGYAQCETCKDCPKDHYISTPCRAGTPFKKTLTTQVGIGHNTKCKKCTKRPAGSWTVFPCSSKHTSDAIYQKCSKCVDGEYTFKACAANADTVCPACPSHVDKLFADNKDFKSGLQYCAKDTVTNQAKIRCWAKPVKQADGTSRVEPQASHCGEWSDRKRAGKDNKRCRPGHTQGGGNCGAWTSYCKDGFSGESCCYHKYPKSCGTITSRERTGKRAGFVKGKDFVAFCRTLCDEFPDCLAFEVQDGGTAAAPNGSDDLNNNDAATCFFKAAYSQNQRFQYEGKDPKFDCYSNTCRQNKYTTIGGKAVATVNYRIKATDAKKKFTVKDINKIRAGAGKKHTRISAAINK
jgi:hypothetical protein